MALVAYSESSSSDEDEAPAKRQRVAPPIAWTRTFAHVDGNWPSYVYFAVPLTPAMEAMKTFAMTMTDAAYPKHALGLVPLDEKRSKVLPKDSDGDEDPSSLHLSLSRTFVLRYEQIEPFVQALRIALKYRKRQRIGLQGHRILINDEKTRLFAATPVVRGKLEICHIIACVDRCMRQFDLAPYYSDPIPHVSVASTPIVPSVDAKVEMEMAPPPMVLVDCDAVAVTIGNKQFHIPLLS
ncbi:hypothetical protein SPRG_19728 [Saprolegnia parasitica CBS 223.65]|uniref:U6 snRNA phosphodiesterase 1 n=1 Tax=Saprolegnia parasitica (strain CBS 223.65) TaxID=695850 RepID=A0A067CTI8_SAPPC|nr:hypothetical protein SPRG_19728 [Saprolegnia parasitica CBS 223.65]KDO29846.1 hypothetical protein SPRG_19728 [Saprolegnia parasitica CBS 223.65]|eukprot:XP_012199547.1 hypothetical protein SPRG_19728 [Saprolegnia parasitica CBS 223.65]